MWAGTLRKVAYAVLFCAEHRGSCGLAWRVVLMTRRFGEKCNPSSAASTDSAWVRVRQQAG